MAKKKVEKAEAAPKARTMSELMAESSALDQRIGKAQDVIARLNELKGMVTVQTGDEGLQGIVDVVGENVEFLQKVMTTRIESWQLQKAELESKEVK